MPFGYGPVTPDYYRLGYFPNMRRQYPGAQYMNNYYADYDYQRKDRKHKKKRKRDNRDSTYYYGQIPPYMGGPYYRPVNQYDEEPYQQGFMTPQYGGDQYRGFAPGYPQDMYEGAYYNQGPYSPSNLLSKVGPMMDVLKALGPILFRIL